MTWRDREAASVRRSAVCFSESLRHAACRFEERFLPDFVHEMKSAEW